MSGTGFESVAKSVRMTIIALCTVLAMLLVSEVRPTAVGLELPEDVQLPGPVMGWATWPKYGTNRDCDDETTECIRYTFSYFTTKLFTLYICWNNWVLSLVVYF